MTYLSLMPQHTCHTDAEGRPQYEECEACIEEHMERQLQERLRLAKGPDETEPEQAQLEALRELGTLVLLGAVTLLAVALYG